MVAWALIGAQGRYRLATSIATGCSMLITIPLAWLLTTVLRINLQGLTFAVVIGYTIIALWMSVVLLISDWERRSKKIVDRMTEDDSDTHDELETEFVRLGVTSSGKVNVEEPEADFASLGVVGCGPKRVSLCFA
mmetsp:Transcript_16197/g.35059  ORF Transcript_16197/g.35059 Transcript_16197/m.35059 type:complete len:135 (+) Transcript_16197:3-407(+)